MSELVATFNIARATEKSLEKSGSFSEDRNVIGLSTSEILARKVLISPSYHWSGFYILIAKAGAVYNHVDPFAILNLKITPK